MSNDQSARGAAVELEMRASLGSSWARPHFRLIRPTVESAHEQAVINAGYPWVRTNALIPTWMSPDPDPRPRPSNLCHNIVCLQQLGCATSHAWSKMDYS